MGAVLCLGIPIAAYIALAVGASGTQRPDVSASATAAQTETSVAVSNEFVAERQPGMPDPGLTPGQTLPGSTLSPNAEALAATPPPISPEVRAEVLQTYRIPDADAERQVLTYLIPPSLNGADTAANVFPVTPWFADLKRRLDRQLTQKVTRGEVTLAAAHEELKSNWVSAAHRHYVRNYGENDAAAARNKENQLNWEKSNPAPGGPDSAK